MPANCDVRLCLRCTSPVRDHIFKRNHLWAAVGLISLAIAASGMVGQHLHARIRYVSALRWARRLDSEASPLFFIFGSMHLVALLVIHLIVPRIEHVEM